MDTGLRWAVGLSMRKIELGVALTLGSGTLVFFVPFQHTDAMALESNYESTFRHVRGNARGLAYDVGYRLIGRDDGTFVYGFEIVQDQSGARMGSGASALDFQGSYAEAEAFLRRKLVHTIESLPEWWESDRYRNRNPTDESAVANASRIRDVFGYWPAFHDAEVISIEWRKRSPSPRVAFDLILSLRHGGQDNPNWQGNAVAHHVVKFMFENIEGKEFATHNVSEPTYVSDLLFSRCDDGRIQVDLDPHSGFSILIFCETARVISVEPCSGV
jgi:hypothetical protein